MIPFLAWVSSVILRPPYDFYFIFTFFGGTVKAKSHEVASAQMSSLVSSNSWSSPFSQTYDGKALINSSRVDLNNPLYDPLG